MAEWDDPTLYRKMSEPYASKEEASEALNKFMAAVQDARQHNRIGNVVLMAVANVIDGQVGAHLNLGESGMHELMAAELFAAVSADRRALVEKRLRKADDA